MSTLNNSYVIGIGSQRAGSTLLHKILSSATDIFMHPVKELHYFDTLHKVRNRRVLQVYCKVQLDSLWDRIIREPELSFIDDRERCRIHALKQLWNTIPENIRYEDLFRPFVQRKQYLGEVTPEYMILPAEGVANMRATLGQETRIILLARSPVQRFLSSVKLLHAYGKQADKKKHPDFNSMVKAAIDEMPKWMEQQGQLNDYEQALSLYQSEFDHVLFLSYDQLISRDDCVRRALEDFLNMPIRQEDFDSSTGTKINALSETPEISQHLTRQLEARFASSQRFLDQHFSDGGCIK